MTTHAGLDASLELSVQLGRVADRLEKDALERRRAREIARARVPAIVTLKTSGVIPTPTAPFGLNFGGPDPGFHWTVRRLVVGGLAWATTAAGTFEAYVTGLGALIGSSSGGGAASNPAGVRMLTDVVDQGSMPYRNWYGRDEILVKESESLVVVVAGGTAGQQYTASALVQVVRTVDAIANWDEGF